MFKVTKEMLVTWFNQGLTTQEVANAITIASGSKCTVGSVKKFAKHYGINLRSKPRKSNFTVEDIIIVDEVSIVDSNKELDIEANTVSITGTIKEFEEFMNQPAKVENL